MTSATDHDRFAELDAGRVLGDLSADELREWETLSRELGASPDRGLDVAAAAIEATLTGPREDALPEDVAQRIREQVVGRNAAHDGTIIRPAIWNRVLGGEAGWAVAAVLAALLIATFLTRVSTTDPQTADRARESLLESTLPLITSAFSGVGDYESMSGDVVWSDDRQEGYMTLKLPANDPTVAQYQLWIVDPERDEAPVDGGVFDIPAGQPEVVIPIDAKLAIADPKAFVITLEQPGGVVKSKQEVVVALASL